MRGGLGIGRLRGKTLGMARKTNQIEMIEGILDRQLWQAQSRYLEDGGDLVQGEIDAGGPDFARLFKKIGNSVGAEVEAAIDEGLKDLAANVEVGSKDWFQLHDYFAERFDLQFAKIFDFVEVRADDEGAVRQAKAKLHVILLNSRARIYTQKAGWGVPRRKPWYQSNPIAVKVIDWAIPAALGALVALGGEHLIG